MKAAGLFFIRVAGVLLLVWAGLAQAQWTGVFNPVLQVQSGTFPTVVNTNTTFGVSTGIHNLPSGYVAGNLLLLYYQSSDATSPTTPTGWTSLFNASPPTGVQRGAVFYKVSAGTEGSTVTITGGTTQSSITYAAAGFQGTPELASSSGNGTANIDPPNLTPSWGNAKNLWIASGQSILVTISGTPTGFTNTIVIASRLTTSQQQLQATSLDPSTYTQSNTTAWQATTLAIRGL